MAADLAAEEWRTIHPLIEHAPDMRQDSIKLPSTAFCDDASVLAATLSREA